MKRFDKTYIGKRLWNTLSWAFGGIDLSSRSPLPLGGRRPTTEDWRFATSAFLCSNDELIWILQKCWRLWYFSSPTPERQ